MGGEAELVVFESTEEVDHFFREEAREDISYRVLGGGSNILVSDDIPKTVFVQTVYGDLLYKEACDTIFTTAPAHMVWDDFVKETVEKGYGDLAALSLIPGSVGATPVQNVGAYGVETKDMFISLTAYDMKKKVWVTFDKEGCAFGYRKSVFQERKEFIITSVTFGLHKGNMAVPSYGGFAHLTGQSISPLELRNEVIRQRDSKLPRAGDVASVGSFFKNPVVTSKEAEKLKEMYPAMPQYVSNGSVKLAAGWLIEHSDAVYVKSEHFALYEKNKLVVVHNGNGNIEKLFEFQDKIQRSVYEKYGVHLEREPEVVGKKY